MRKFKYIIVLFGNHEIAITFPDFVGHDEMARMMGPYRKPISAGFFTVCVDEDRRAHADAYGESVSLKLKSRPEDSKIIDNSIGTRDPYSF